MKYFKLLLVLFTSIAISMPHSTYAQSALHVSSPPIVKINQYYILFTYPTSPYVDRNNRLLVPLRSLSDLLGAKVAYDAATKQATIQLDGHQLVLTANSKTAIVDQQTKTMDTVPVQQYNALFVPLKVMIDYLAVNGAYHAETKTIELNDPKYMKNTPRLTEETQDRANLDENKNAFAVTSFQINVGKSNKNGVWTGSFTYKAENITGNTIEQGKEDVHCVILLTNGVSQAEVYNYMREKHKAVKAGQSITKTQKLIGNADLAYIIIKPYAVK
ncbi:copper amine oxidase N-terminal domain-containing protein [Paenibacillus campi]|uniref:copper amine oxidase N-terminal domain-containing protein n=1 Tax=Paenibacillus campi TaxID=3106031 RepID=UPI002AFF750F|nr:copper amine oxidase N-terminal domain-containing protein [Paenibacillus sp. SGZ-1014]